MNNSKVKVAVRVRPLNPREEGLKSECVVRVSENQITLLPPISCKEKARKEPHIFIYDNCFWTKDKYDTGQEDVFKHLGDGVLQNIWLGFNVCIFAYGQTGSGKTFSMMGTDDQPGIVPRICSALFNKESNDLETIRIEASYFEIYNEEVRDLLRSENNQTKLRVREDRLLGPYVEELSCHAVQSYEEIKLLLDQGNKQRAIAETKMNEQSSRSHAILALTVTQTCHKMSHDHMSGASRELVSKVSLVDLAGSERSYKSGAQGSQLKESCNINKSLLTLGLVINSLAEISENKRKSQYVNYRDSVLTWLLKNNLGGNSKTIMLATVSPAADNYQETLSTLRYADSAKRIVNQAVVNEDVKSKAIEELQEEIKRLREQLTTTEHVKTEVQKLKSQLEEKENLLSDLKTSWEEKLKRTEVATQEWKKNLEHMGVILKKQNVTFSNDCYLMQQSTSLTMHNINDIIKIGSGPSQDIQISGPDVECEHCVIRKTEEGEVFLIAVNNSKTHVNGCLSKIKTQLWHEDKIQIGINVFELLQPRRPKPEYMRTNVSSEAEVQTYDELNTDNGRSPILSERDGWNSNMIEKSKTKSAFYKANESSAPTIPASDDDLNSSENKQTSDMFTQISNEPNRQPIDMEVNTTKSEYLEIGEGTEDIMVPCSPQYGEASSQTSEMLVNSNGLQSNQDLEDRANLPRILEISREKKELQRTLRRDMCHPSPDNEMEEPDIPLCDTIPNDPVVTSLNDTCEENQNVKTQNVPPQQSNSDTSKASPHENVLHPECNSFSEKSQAEPDLNTSSKTEPLQNDKDLCDNDREVDKEVASGGPPRTHRQDMSPTSPGDDVEESNIPTCDQISVDSGVTSQHNTCEENQNEKSEEVPHQQSNPDTYNTCSHENVLHQECDSSSEESKAKPDLNTSSKIELLQNEKGLCDNDGDGDTNMASGGLQKTRRQDTTQPSPHVEIEKPNISPSDKIPDDSQVTSQHETCEENQHEKTEEVPPQQSNSDTNIASPHENVLHQECEFSSEKPKAEPDLNTSSKIEMQKDKGLCDNDREGDKEVASDELQRTRRQDTSHPHPDDKMEEPHIPLCDKIPDDPVVTSQNDTCEENQNVKTQNVPPQQSNSDTCKGSPHENVLHPECDSFSEKSQAEPDLNTSSKREPLQNDKDLCDNDGEGDKEVASDGLQTTHRQDMSPTSPGDEMEEYNIPTCDQIPDDSGVTSQHNTCEENQNEKSEEVPHQQSNTDNTSSHESVVHQECDSSSEESKAKPDLNTSPKIELLQNDKGLCDNGGDGDTDMASGGLQRTRRQDTSHPHPDDKIEEPHIPLCDKIPDDPVVTSQNDTCEENQNGKTQNVPPQQSNSDTCKGSPHENVLHPECDSFSEKSQAEPDLNTSSKREPLQNDKDLCDNDGEGDKEVASDGLQTTHRQDMSPTSPGDEMEEYNIPTCDQIPDDSGVTSQHNTCEENQNEKSEEVPHQQSNPDTYNTSSHENVLHQECDSSSEESKAKPDLNTSSKIELLQNEKGLCDNDGDGDTNMASGGLQKTRRQDTSHPSPHVEIEKPNISPSDKIPDDSQVTLQHETCEESQHEKTEEVPPQQSNSDTNIASPHENVLHQECEFSSEKPKAEPDLNTSSKIEMQNDKGLCDNDREGDKEVASDELQRTRRQDMSHTSLDDKMEESNIPPGDKLPDDTSQHHTCKENQNEKTEEVPHQQSNTDTYNASPRGSVLHQESDDSSEKPKVEPDLNTSSKKELPQNDKGHCDLDGENDTGMSSDDDFVDCSSEFTPDEEHTSCESTIQLQNAAKDSTDPKEPDIDPNTLSSETSIPSVFSEESRKEIQNEKENMFKELLEKMKIDTKQTSKLTLQKVLEIGPESLMTDDPCDDDNALWYFVRRLMSLNGDARNINKLFMKSEESGGNKDDSFISFDESDSQNFIHPLDVVSAAFHCSDHFLQQEMMSKMSMCQFAVPLLLPDADGPECTFMLWAMRGIVKKWRPQSLADSKGFIEDSLVNVQMPTISFVRLGNCRLSKSKILNQLLGTTQHQHEHFIHRDMEGGNAARKISEGLVEISWYFPGGKGKFPEPVAFTNLRGTLESNMKEFNFLIEISSVIVILTEGISKDQYDLLMKYNGYDTKFLLIISPENTRMKEDTQERLKLLAPVLNLTKDSVSMIPRNTNETTAGSKLYSSLLSLVQNNIKTLSLEEISKQASRHGIRIDEDFGECQEAKLAAKEITEEIEDVEKYKKETMKLQAGPLKEMAKFEKEMCQMKGQGNSNGEKYKSNLRKKCNSIRQNQWECDIPTGISKFVNALTSTNTSEKFYFLQWLKFYLDVEARKCLYPLQAQYKEMCNLSGKQKELTELDQKISDSSLGIEHFLREVGQFYEAWHSMGKKEKSTTINFESLPKIAADLLLDGFPLELIDGDASRIPLQWIKDVLTELDKKVKGKSRLRVITVLGVQSTGKSTLLNTMFGLQFPVASGRCTRGAFMTLLRVKEHFQSYFMCQFILVIDTEGLKAPELDSLEGSYEHDNELATLVIGLSDITLINMSMENTTEMKDILQIVIHAFLRMKEIGKKPNCQFVHQNVSDVSAPSMNMRGRKKMMDQLDEMTRTVAVMEKKTQFSCFSDIMEYDLEHNNCYIAGLWHGGPPMASVSSAYSENVNELKQKLLKIMKDRHKTQNIIEFILWVSDIWSAVKHENFIFSFRNSVIAKAYNQLSIKYSEREWKFNKLMHEWFTNSETLIKNQSAETLEAKANKCKKDAECILTREGKEILAWLEEYFSKETDGAQLIKYKTDFVISAQNLIKSLETSSITKLNKTIQTQKDNISVQDVYRQQIKRIEQQVSNFIEECRQRKHEPSNAELEEELEKIWNNAAKNLKVSHRKERNIEGEMLLVLTKDMKERGSGVNENIQKTKHFPKPKKQQKTSFIIQTFTTISYQFKKWKGVFPYEDFFQNVLHKCINYSERQTQIDADYDDTYCREILNIIDENCKHNDAKNYFSADRELELKLNILGHVLVDFQTMHLNFLKKNDPHAKLNSLKPVYFKTFKNVFQKKNESKSLAERVCKDVFKPSLTDHINRKLGIEMVDDITNSNGSGKYTSRMFFQFSVLENLLEEDNFQNYVNYSSDYKNFVKSWITNYIVEEYTNISTLQERILSNIMGRVRSSLNNPPGLNLRGVSDFLPHLCEKLNSDLVLPQQTMEAIIFKNSATIEDFINYMKKSLTETEEEIRAELQSLSTEDVLSSLVVKPQDELFNKVFGCGKQCPFCKVPCEAGGTDHKEHFASVHRPQGLGRHRWETTEILCHDMCTTSVVGNTRFMNELTDGKFYPYKDYRDFYPDWKIQPDESIEASDYWKFILKEYNKQFAEEYKAKPANYPEEWDSLTREMAKESLQKTFNM